MGKRKKYRNRYRNNKSKTEKKVTHSRSKFKLKWSWKWLIVLFVPLLFLVALKLFRVSMMFIKYGTSLSDALLYMSLSLLLLTVFSIGLFKSKFKNFSDPYWILVLGLITTFIGFTLSGAFQEKVQDSMEKKKLSNRLYALIQETDVQRKGLEKTIFDFQRVLFEEDKSHNKKQFYVRKQLSVYNESDVKDILSYDIYAFSFKDPDLKFDDLLITNTGPISQTYDNLTFKSNDPEEMLNSYFELISLRYHIGERMAFIGSEFRYITGQSWDKTERQLKVLRKNNKKFALKIINEAEELIKENYPEVHMKVDKEGLLE